MNMRTKEGREVKAYRYYQRESVWGMMLSVRLLWDEQEGYLRIWWYWGLFLFDPTRASSDYVSMTER